MIFGMIYHRRTLQDKCHAACDNDCGSRADQLGVKTHSKVDPLAVFCHSQLEGLRLENDQVVQLVWFRDVGDGQGVVVTARSRCTHPGFGISMKSPIGK